MLAVSDLFPRCHVCNKLLARKVTRPWSIQCVRCKTIVDAPHPAQDHTVVVEVCGDNHT